MNFSGFFKVLFGFILAIALLAGGSVVLARYLIIRFTTPPPRPVFANDKPSENPQAVAANNSQASATPTQSKPAPQSSPAAKPLEPGAYKGRVTQQIGLILRDSPSYEAGQIGGIDYNESVVILEESADKVWQRVRVENSDREGWVKAGNTERIN